MRRTASLSWLLAVCALAGFCVRSAPAAEKPNIVIFLADDQGWGDLSVHGNTNLSTPNIDKLAQAGAAFDHFFVCPVCSPTRAEFLTGRYHPRGGVWNVTTGGERLNLDEKTIGDTFKAAGYATALFGKWHNGTQYPYHPNARGFDQFYGFTSGHWGDYYSPPLELNGKRRPRRRLPCRRPGRPGADFRRQEPGPAILLLHRLQHAAFAHAGA